MQLFSLTDPLFWIWFSLSFVAIGAAWYIPGIIVVRHLKLSFVHRFPLAIAVGIILWGWQGYIFGTFHIRWATYLYLLIFWILWFVTCKMPSKKNIASVVRQIVGDKLLLGLIVFGVCVQMTTLLFVGVPTQKGLMLCCGNSNDNIWFASLTQAIVNRFPPEQPGLSGVVVHNYHYWSNIVIAELVRVFHLPLFIIHFQVSGLLLSLLLGLLAVQFGNLLGLGKVFNRWLVLFLYFGGDAIWALLFFLGKGTNFSMSSLEDGTKFLGNLPRAFAVVLFLAGLNIFIIARKKFDWKTTILLALLFGSLVVYKIYLGLFAFVGFGLLGLIELTKKRWHVLAMVGLAGVCAAFAYLPTNSQAGGLFFTGFWRAENFIVQPMLGMIRWEMARIIFVEHHNALHAILYDFFFFAIYTFAIFGSKLLGIFQTKSSLLRIPKEIHIILLAGIVVSGCVGFFFEQHVGEANTFNFLVSVFILSSIYAALACSYWIGKMPKILKYVLVIFIVLLTVPRALFEARANIHKVQTHDTYVIPWAHMQAMDYVRKSTAPTALVAVQHREIYYDSTGPLISVFANRPMFFSGEGLYSSYQVPVQDQKSDEKIIFESTHPFVVAQTLEQNGIDYLFYLNILPLPATESAYFLDTVYKNADITVARVRHDVIARDFLLPVSIPSRKH